MFCLHDLLFSLQGIYFSLKLKYYSNFISLIMGGSCLYVLFNLSRKKALPQKISRCVTSYIFTQSSMSTWLMPWSHRVVIGRGPAYHRWYLPKFAGCDSRPTANTEKIQKNVHKFQRRWAGCLPAVRWCTSGAPPAHRRPTAGPLPAHRQPTSNIEKINTIFSLSRNVYLNIIWTIKKLWFIFKSWSNNVHMDISRKRK